MRNRRSILFGALWGVLLLVVLAAYWSMGRSYQQLRAAQFQLRECEKITEDIQALQARPGFASLGIDSPRTITARAEEAGQQANILPMSLVRIEPQPAVRLRDSPYRLRPTRLELRRVTLEQIVSFTHAMIDEAQGTTVRDIRLTAFEGATESSAVRDKEIDWWTAELVLTQLIYAPLRR